ncbi:hypothetical protein EYM_05580 [Ignicoccus islandicus DSM 13165]|uniref:Uncharacterized protein n=1 Tax=Ignicoccus islandicus DSM 13165 TaxID=940295 RepID=A0A0U3F4V6_9CREN|nr:hypothetical protein [Ignicoccus islandicus]ALU12597.1 hypothetical protein EYM_05580 [Ignicoccus islandicus DSM 13165]
MKSLFDLLKRELDTNDLLNVSATTWEELISEYRKFAVMCSESTNRENCGERLREYKRMFKNLFKFRIYKAMIGEEVPNDSVDSNLIELILRIISDYVDALDEVIADENGKVYVIVKRKIEINGMLLHPNELTLANLSEAVALSAFGYVELLRLPSETSDKYEWMKKEKLSSL